MPPARSHPPEAPTIEAGRLRLRAFTPDDRPAYAAMRADPDVVRYLVGGEALIAFADEIAVSRINAFREAWRSGFGVWAVEETASGRFLGQVGLEQLEQAADVEVLYAFARHAWGRGYAREATRAALAFAFDDARLPRVVAFVVPQNTASSRVLEAVGFRSIGATTYNDFPVLGYAITAEEWTAARG
ncbi:MAG: GNAT family N-acetyltransferase [Thalassobaculaceae bacterium]|nr:GNAT family N-acetyltransferase [Thalassobaculaceae bacterium]